MSKFKDDKAWEKLNNISLITGIVAKSHGERKTARIKLINEKFEDLNDLLEFQDINRFNEECITSDFFKKKEKENLKILMEFNKKFKQLNDETEIIKRMGLKQNIVNDALKRIARDNS